MPKPDHLARARVIATSVDLAMQSDQPQNEMALARALMLGQLHVDIARVDEMRKQNAPKPKRPKPEHRKAHPEYKR